MPELPEVETIRRQLDPRLRGRPILEATSHHSDKFTSARAATGHTIGTVGRRGKYLILGLDGTRELVIHLGMTGQLGVRLPGQGDQYTRAEWTLDRGEVLSFRDIRRFGRIAVVPTGDYRELPTLRDIGPEPLGSDFDPDTFARGLRSSSRRVKTQLLGQRVVAGVGNIYADEALWLAGINPASRRVTAPQAVRLHDAIRQVLRTALDDGGTTLRDYRTANGESGAHQDQLRCYGRAGSPCARCGTTLRRRVIDARTTTWCPVCQRR